MHIMVRIGIIFAVFLAVSCSQNLESVPKYEFCKYKMAGKEFCKSSYEVDCKEVEGRLMLTDTCEEEPLSSSSVVTSSSSSVQVSSSSGAEP